MPALVLEILAGVVFVVWPSLPGLLLARVLSGLGVGAVTATAAAWLSELRGAGSQRAQILSTAANLGGLGLGALISGLLAQSVGYPLVVPFTVFIVALGLAWVALHRGARDAGAALVATALPRAADIGAGTLARAFLGRRIRRCDHVFGVRVVDLARAELSRRDA